MRHQGHVHGPGDALSDCLRWRKIPHAVLCYPLDGKGPIRLIRVDTQGCRSEEIVGWSTDRPLPIRALWEVMWTVKVLRSFPKPIPLFIGIDPVHAWAGIWLKWQRAVRHAVFYTADYAEQRFESRWLNGLYHAMDRWAARWADRVWTVSSRIFERRRLQGILPEKLRLIPNAPDLAQIPDRVGMVRDRFTVVTMATMQGAMDNRLLLQAVARLRCEVPRIRVKILGVKAEESDLAAWVDKLHLNDCVEFLGFLPQSAIWPHLFQSGVGAALYTEHNPWTRFGDAKKVREYLACGLPVLMTPVPSVAEEVERLGAGVVVPLDLNCVFDGLRRLILEETFYEQCAQAAYRLACQWDLGKLLKEEFFGFGLPWQMS